MPSAVGSIGVMLGAWSLLLATPLLAAPLLPPGGAGPRVAALGLLLASVFVLALRPRAGLSTRAAGVVPALAAGWAGLPAALFALSVAGAAAGLPSAAPRPPDDPDAWSWLASVGLAPLLEEALYRERLLLSLRAAWGTPLSVLASSALFALPHANAWSVFSTFWIGLSLSGVALASGSLPVCVGVHAGLNLAWLAGAAHPLRPQLSPTASALVAAPLLAVAIARARAT